MDDATIEGHAEATSDAKIRMEGIRKQFGRIVAIDDVSLTVRGNEIFALIGDNGAGKSTLMNVLSGVHEPTRGTVYYDEEPVEFSNPSDARAVGIETVYQDLALMDDLDVATNIFMGQFPKRSFGRIDWEKTHERAGRILREELNKDLNTHAEVEFLSGGERQLVAIARALAFDPEVIILDEPTSALSIEATRLVQERVRQLREQGLTIIVISHNVEEVLDLADRVGVLYQGRLVDVAEIDEVNLEILRDLIVTGERGD